MSTLPPSAPSRVPLNSPGSTPLTSPRAPWVRSPLRLAAADPSRCFSVRRLVSPRPCRSASSSAIAVFARTRWIPPDKTGNGEKGDRSRLSQKCTSKGIWRQGIVLMPCRHMIRPCLCSSDWKKQRSEVCPLLLFVRPRGVSPPARWRQNDQPRVMVGLPGWSAFSGVSICCWRGYIDMFVYICVYRYIYIYMHMYTYTHMYIYTHM